MAISFVASTSGDNTPIVMPPHETNDLIVLLSDGWPPATSPLLATPGFTQVTINSSLPNTSPANYYRLEYMRSPGGTVTIDPSPAPSNKLRLFAIYRNAALVAEPLVLRASELVGGSGDNHLFFDSANLLIANAWAFAVAMVTMGGDATDTTLPPATLTRRVTMFDQNRFALYDSNGPILNFVGGNGPNFTPNHSYRTLIYSLKELEGAFVNTKIEPIFLVSDAEVVDQTIATLNSTISCFVEAEADVPQVIQATVNASVGFVTLNSTANITQAEPVICTPDPAPVIDGCVSVVNHAVYTSFRLYDVLTNALLPAIRESNPATAYDTMPDWLDRLNWVDCMGACRMPGINGILPNEIIGECGSTMAEFIYTDCLTKTIQHGIILALTRMQYGRTKNLCFVNDVIAPLGAVVYPTPGLEAECPHKMTIAPLTDYLPSWQRAECVPQAATTCLAYYTPTPLDPPGLPSRIYPGLMAAECIVRSMFTQHRFIEFERLIAVPGSIPSCSSLEL